ncbi:MAG: hypothetical protein IPP83_07165 [Flavobacteriales bacterium]|nr:hypothetical protein [Flavobacteriales bacterium]
MRTIILRSRIRTAGLLFGASLLLIGCGEKCPPENKGGAPGKKLALTGCEGGTTRHRRAKFYTRPELSDADSTFSVHFMYDPDGPQSGADPVEITDTKVSIPWPDLLAAEAVVESKVHKPVRGILIHYGMDREKFKPLFQFMYPDESSTERGDLVLYKDKYFHMDHGSLVEIDSIIGKKYMANYITTVTVMRVNSGFSKISTGPGNVDPLGEWFSYADNVNALYAANAGGLKTPGSWSPASARCCAIRRSSGLLMVRNTGTSWPCTLPMGPRTSSRRIRRIGIRGIRAWPWIWATSVRRTASRSPRRVRFGQPPDRSKR